jgi:glucose/arabinose dehydrogenase
VPPPPPPPPGSPTLQTISTSLSNPVYLTAPVSDSARVFVVQQGGLVRIMRHDTLLAGSFLNLSGKITSGGERGLLSLAFSPQYATNGRFYVYFTDPHGDIRIVRYNVSATNPDSADQATADTVLKVPHPVNANHNGGQLQFGTDGMLYAGTGDGGGAGDTAGNAQNTHSLLGKLLRVDVSGASGYTIPASNPFAADTTLGSPEIWSYGLRNPWRFSFDKATGDLYIGDVGQDSWEEVDISSAAVQAGRGANFGWNTMEGKHCYPPAVTTCNQTGLVLPVTEYPHQLSACTVIGGYVYHGASLPSIAGYYFYADYCNGVVLSFRYNAGNVTTQLDWSTVLSPGSNISSFGQDAKGELYMLTLGGGVYRVVPTR